MKVGIQLFDRTVRPPVLALAGTSILRSGREVTAKLRELEDAEVVQPEIARTLPQCAAQFRVAPRAASRKPA